MENIASKLERFLKFIVLKQFKINLSDAVRADLIQFVKFGIVGFSNTVIGYLIYVAALDILRAKNLFAGSDIYVAQLISFILSVAWSFYWNNKMVFKQENGENRNILAALMKTYLSYAFTSLFLSEALLLLWVGFLGINEYVAPAITLIVTVPLNFVIQKFWAFKKEK